MNASTRPRKTSTRPKARKRSRPSLDRDIVIQAALAEIDEKGAEAFTMRDLARRLDVFPTAIYWHVPTRNHILADVAAEMFRNVVPKRRSKDWRTALRTTFLRFRQGMRRHPNVAPLIGTQMIGNASIDLGFAEGVLETLDRAGLAGDSLVAAYNAVVASLVGFVAQEFSPIPTDGTAQWQLDIRKRLIEADPKRYPVLTANLPDLANQAFILRWQNGSEAPLDASYKAYIEQVIAGIESLTRR